MDSINRVLRGLTFVSFLLRAASIGIKAGICPILVAIDHGRRYTLSDVDREVVAIDVVCAEGIDPSQPHLVELKIFLFFWE